MVKASIDVHSGTARFAIAVQASRIQRAQEIAEAVTQKMENALLRGSMERMSDLGRRVLGRRYGLDGREQATVDKPGEALGATRERVRQFQHNAERRLRGRLRRRSGAVVVRTNE